MDILCTLHDSDEYGVLRWKLDDILRAAGVSEKSGKELVSKLVLKGSDGRISDFTYTPRHAGKDGETVVLISACDGPCWYSSRMVTDEWIRNRRGEKTQFTSQPKSTPKIPIGGLFGDGPTSSSTSSSISTPKPPNGEWHPTAEQLRLGGLFGRKPTTRWHPKEIKAWKEVTPIEESDLKLLEDYYGARIPEATDYRRHDLTTLLNNFAGELDRARNYKPSRPF